MTKHHNTHRLGDVRDHLEDRLDELAELAATSENATYDGVASIAGKLELQLGGVVSLIDDHGEDAELVLRELTAGTHAQMEDRIAAKREQSRQENLPGYRDNVVAAAGLVDAPFLPDRDPEMSEEEWFEVRLSTVADEPPGVAKWLAAKTNDHTKGGGTGFPSFRERYQEKVER